MNPGRLDRHASLWKQTEVKALSGERTPSWAKVADIWSGPVQPARGTRSPSDGAVARESIDLTSVIRWTPLLAPGVRLSDFEFRVTESGERYRINAAPEIYGRRNCMQLELTLVTEALR